jgi:Trk K+ transport system NAD-binding subunit
LNIYEASSVVIALGNSEKLYLVCETIRELSQDVKTVVKVNSYQEKEMLLELGLTHILVETEQTAESMYKEALRVDVRY